MRVLILSIWVGVFCSLAAGAVAAGDLEAGRQAYVENCARCHGDLGQGDGPDAMRMVPRPRDLTSGVYKFRTTASGTPPTDEDLFRTITSGLAGTRMLGWEGLSEQTRRQLVAYLKSLSPKFAEAQPQPIDIGQDPGPKKVDLAKGKQLYADLGCAACHGAAGRANGPSAKGLADDWGQPIRVANLTHGWTLRGGSEPKDLVVRLMTGVDGTPMPSYADAVSKEDLWPLAYYLQSIQERPRWGWTVEVAQVAQLPAIPTDPLWERAPRTDVKLWSNLYSQGQVVPASIPWAMIQAVSTGEEVAFRIAWDDPTEDRQTPPDRLALVFIPEGVGWEIGSLQSWPTADSKALNFILWSAATETAIEDVAMDFESPATVSSRLQPIRPAQAQYEDGRWWLMVTRPLEVPGALKMAPGAAVPLALVAWDGGQGDTGRKRSVSMWLDVRLNEKGGTHGSHEPHSHR